MPNARWGWTDEAVAALEGAQRHGFMGGVVPREQQRASTKPQPTKKRRTR